MKCPQFGTTSSRTLVATRRNDAPRFGPAVQQDENGPGALLDVMIRDVAEIDRRRNAFGQHALRAAIVRSRADAAYRSSTEYGVKRIRSTRSTYAASYTESLPLRVRCGCRIAIMTRRALAVRGDNEFLGDLTRCLAAHHESGDLAFARASRGALACERPDPDTSIRSRAYDPAN